MESYRAHSAAQDGSRKTSENCPAGAASYQALVLPAFLGHSLRYSQVQKSIFLSVNLYLAVSGFNRAKVKHLLAVTGMAGEMVLHRVWLVSEGRCMSARLALGSNCYYAQC